MNSPFNVISTFSGCGGSSLGYKLAGGKVRLAVEWDNNAVETYKLNFPNTPIHHGDIANLSVDECLKLAGLAPGELDVLDGSPPCQGFSTAGKRNIDDTRNQLFREYARLLAGLQPKAFVMENVSGMVKGKMKLIFVEILQALKEAGYNVSARLLNTKYFNVPQSRERLIFIGIRNDLGIVPDHPQAVSRPITPREAFVGVTDHDAPLLPVWLAKAAMMMRPGSYSETAVKQAFLACKGTAGGSMNTKLLSWDRCACTIIKSEMAATCLIHPDKQRKLSIQELKRLSSFPDDFQFVGNRKSIVERIGNTVPPNFMRAIAEHVKRTLADNGH